MTNKIAGSVVIRATEQMVANRLKALEIAPNIIQSTYWNGSISEKEIYEKAEKILDWAYGISESDRKQ